MQRRANGLMTRLSDPTILKANMQFDYENRPKERLLSRWGLSPCQATKGSRQSEKPIRSRLC